MGKQLLECQRCLELKDPVAFYLKSAKNEVPERREKICKACKKGHKQARTRSEERRTAKSLAPDLEGLEEMTSVFLRLKQWRDEREAVVKVSNQDSFDMEQTTSDKEMWRDYA